jgi:arylsulfatase
MGAPATAWQYDFNILPIGQQMWVNHLQCYITYLPLRAPKSYNLSQVIAEVKKAQSTSHAGE